MLELLAVVTVVGIVAGMAALRYGETTLGETQGQGFARKIAQGLQLARRHAVASGASAALRFQTDGGAISSFDIVRVTSGGDEVVEKSFSKPAMLTVTAPAHRWEFGFDGALTTPAASGTIEVSSSVRDWSVYVYALSGRIRLTGV